jgi:hypothetical protein
LWYFWVELALKIQQLNGRLRRSTKFSSRENGMVDCLGGGGPGEKLVERLVIVLVIDLFVLLISCHLPSAPKTLGTSLLDSPEGMKPSEPPI